MVPRGLRSNQNDHFLTECKTFIILSSKSESVLELLNRGHFGGVNGTLRSAFAHSQVGTAPKEAGPGPVQKRASCTVNPVAPLGGAGTVTPRPWRHPVLTNSLMK